MSVDISDVIQQGVDRTFASNGLMYVAIFFVLGALNTLFSGDLFSTQGFGGGGQMMQPMMQPTGPALPIPDAASGLLLLLGGIASIILTIAALRTFVTDETATIPREHATRNLLWAAVNMIVGGIVFALIVGAGFILLIIPGLFLLTALYFWNVFVVVEDDNFIEALKNSWNLTRGNRLTLFGLGVLAILIAGLVNVIIAIPITAVAGAESVISILLTQIPSAFTTVFLLAATAAAYRQLKGAQRP